ncbi:glycoside hydrolase N-terminal domain-containing protein [Streptomyces roseirectus]|uniref:Glycoside hydrolase N-terminal domain-containing protein n=1 Tax=Streptomyces roseirectus TaxID=2768066 RepID=A0A7H0IAQ7_9ACTN|nr:glycoside hydrolase N-terminal domain-containing protein [Streptomyces roseirectus]QNP69873.1 glycoside hydrolase N-terminal domain-containing protein [Streptomyces roseirectus]
MSHHDPAHGTWEPAPADRWEDGYLSGNGHHGALVLGDPRDDRVIVTHHTLVRPNGSEHARAPELAGQLAGVQDRLLAGDLTAAEDFTDHRPLRWVQPFHPAFQTRVRRDAPAPTHGYRRTVDFTTGETTATDADWTSRAFVSRADDVIVQQITAPALTFDLTLDHRLPGAPDDLTVSHTTALTPDGALLTLRARYPGSTETYTGRTRLLVTGGTISLTTTGVRVEGAEAALLLTRVHRHATDPALPEAADYTALLARHLPLHRDAYHRVALDLHADPSQRALPGSELLKSPAEPALLERLFAAGRYHLLSSSGALPPRLTGLWTGDWDTAWSGAFTLDANLNLQTSSAASAALPEVTAALRNLIEGQLDDWRANARAVFGTRGIVAPAHTDGTSGHSFHFNRAYPLHLWTAGADWLLKPLVDHDETTGTRDPRTASALAELAEFYEDFLTRTDDRGQLVVVPSYSPENRPANGSWGALNAAMDLSAARHALLAAADHHSEDPARAARWRALAHRLPPHRVNADGALAEWAWPGLEDTYDHRHLSHLYGVWPLDEITPYDTPDLAEAAHRALELRGAENDSAHGHLHHALIAARLRDGARVGNALAAVLDGDFFHASLMSAHYPHRHVYNADAAHTLPTVLIEALIQSTPTRLVLLPAPAPALAEGRLRGVRTRFGAEIDLDWDTDGARAVVRPTRTLRVELRTSTGVRELALVAGEDHVLTLGTW